VRDQVSHPYKTTGKIIVLYTLKQILTGFCFTELHDCVHPYFFLAYCSTLCFSQ
jgi:hypothetical protein